jgi:putative ABC transport system permease protein
MFLQVLDALLYSYVIVWIISMQHDADDEDVTMYKLTSIKINDDSKENLMPQMMFLKRQFQSGTAAFTLDIAFIALLVGAVGIITTLYTSVNERIKEIGTLFRSH